uniref:Glycoprotein hormone subunit beta domain-containing protein n=1 Tax=Nothobranchius rachovii TaxID=451742 RepID=A0A1A8SMR5_9TELE
MQLVVMAALLVLAEVGQGCSVICHLKNVSIPVESCGITTLIHTTVCEGRCFYRDPIYDNNVDKPEVNTCNGDWSYEVEHIDGCPLGVTYPVARSCNCTACNTESTFCKTFPPHKLGC